MALYRQEHSRPIRRTRTTWSTAGETCDRQRLQADAWLPTWRAALEAWRCTGLSSASVAVCSRGALQVAPARGAARRDLLAEPQDQAACGKASAIHWAGPRWEIHETNSSARARFADLLGTGYGTGASSAI